MMDGALPGELVGTSALWVLLLAAMLLARQYRATRLPRKEAVLTLACQAIHFCEEFLTGFPQRFPPLLGLEPWTDRFFVLFNLSWIAIWIAAIISTSRGAGNFWARSALLFLALAAIANMVAHPAISLFTWGYFPGLVSAVPLGLAGMGLLRGLRRRGVRK